MAKKPRVRTLMESQHVKVSETLLNPLRQQFCHIFLIKLKEFQFEKFLVSSIWKIETIYSRIDSQWQVFSLCKSEYLMKSIRMQFSPKPKMFWQIFSAFLTSKSNFEHFEKRDERHSSFITKLIDWEKRG